MTAKMARRRSHNRRKARLIRRREDRLFFGRGEFPASATWCAQCSCGARAFSRGGEDEWEWQQDFWDAHAYCDEEASP